MSHVPAHCTLLALAWGLIWRPVCFLRVSGPCPKSIGFGHPNTPSRLLQHMLTCSYFPVLCFVLVRWYHHISCFPAMAVPSLKLGWPWVLAPARELRCRVCHTAWRPMAKGHVMELWPLSAGETGRSSLHRQIRDGTGEIPFAWSAYFFFSWKHPFICPVNYSRTLATCNFLTPQQKDYQLTGFLTAHWLIVRHLHM